MGQLQGIFTFIVPSKNGGSPHRSFRLAQQRLCLDHGSVPLAQADFPPPLSRFGPVIGPVILLVGWRPVVLALWLLAVGLHLPAGPLRLPGGDVVAVAGAVAGSQ